MIKLNCPFGPKFSAVKTDDELIAKVVIIQMNDIWGKVELLTKCVNKVVRPPQTHTCSGFSEVWMFFTLVWQAQTTFKVDASELKCISRIFASSSSVMRI